MRSTYGEVIAIEKTVCYSQSLRGGGTPCRAVPHGEAPGLVRMQKGGKAWKRAFIVVSEGNARQGSASRLMIG